MPLAAVLLLVLGGSILVAGVVAAFLLPAPGGGPNLWYLVPAFVFGSLFEIAAAAVVLSRRKR